MPTWSGLWQQLNSYVEDTWVERDMWLPTSWTGYRHIAVIFVLFSAIVLVYTSTFSALSTRRHITAIVRFTCAVCQISFLRYGDKNWFCPLFWPLFFLPDHVTKSVYFCDQCWPSSFYEFCWYAIDAWTLSVFELPDCLFYFLSSYVAAIFNIFCIVSCLNQINRI